MMNTALKEVTIPGRGLALVTGERIDAGQVVMEEDPILVYLSQAAANVVCAHCTRMLPKKGMLPCDGCGEHV